MSCAFNLADRAERGRLAEAYVADWLSNNNFSVIARNFRLKLGEVDIIARQADVVAFIEVKFRASLYFHISQVITPKKQKSIIKTAQLFMLQQGLKDVVIRFDVALLTMNDDAVDLTYIPNAFGPQEEHRCF